MSIYELLIRILMLKMIIVQQKIDLKRVMKILIILLSITLTVIIGTLAVIIIVNSYGSTEIECRLERKHGKGEMEKREWWENSVIYQVELQSFKDSNGNGIGDLTGLSSKLNHFVDAGVDVICLSPIFATSNNTTGNDVISFYDIREDLGTLSDFEEMLAKAHGLGIKVLLDFLLNHVSIDSQYFKLSENRIPGYENIFVWAHPNAGRKNDTDLPSNLKSVSGGSIWEWNVKRQQYYQHQFSKTQADFNFRDPEVRREIKNILKFWLEKGADGFNFEALPHLIEAKAEEEAVYPVKPVTSDIIASLFRTESKGRSKYLNEVYEVLYEWRKFVDRWRKQNSGESILLLAEAHTDAINTISYYGNAKNKSGVHIPYNFIEDLSNKSSAQDFVYVIQSWLANSPYGRVANWVLGTSNNSRVANRFGPTMVDGMNALIMMLPGLACTYQGDELGLKDGNITLEDKTDKSFAVNNWDHYTLDPKINLFPWDNMTNTIFSKKTNLEAQKNANRSHFKVFQTLTKLRKQPALTNGSYYIQAISENTLVLIRYQEKLNKYALLFNVGREDDEVDLARETLFNDTMVVYTCSVQSKKIIGDVIPQHKITLEPGEALVLSFKIN